MELKEIMKVYKDAGFEVNDVRTEDKRAIEVERLRSAHGELFQVTAETLELNPDSGFVEGEWIVIPNQENVTEGTTEAPETTVAPVQTEPAPEVTTSDEKQDYFRGTAVVRVDNRIQNGRVYKQVQTITATYLVSEQEYVNGLTTE